MTLLSVQQIEDLATPAGPIQIKRIEEVDGLSHITISLDARHIAHSIGGIRLKPREIFTVIVPAEYPFAHPSILVPHRRWAGTAHVQWGSVLCIYAAPSVEWNPSEGMRGLIERLVSWLERAATGSLDPEGQPLHPPVAYATATAGSLVVRADLGHRVPWFEGSTSPTSMLYGWCVVNESGRADLVEWLTFGEIADRVLDGAFAPLNAAGHAQFVAPAALISAQIGFEYPKEGAALVGALEEAGVTSAELLTQLGLARLVNSQIELLAGGGIDLPNIVILGTPSRRMDTKMLAHLSAWKLGEVGSRVATILKRANHGDLKPNRDEIAKIAEDWMSSASITWMRIYESRPEITRMRDEGTATESIRGKKILVFGSGALGGAIAEHCVRGGATSIIVVDESRVGPGILVRQPYNDADISRPKSQALGESLRKIGLTQDVLDVAGDAIPAFLTQGSAVPDVDLIIDATADVGVRSALESRRMADREDWPDVITVMVGHDAARGLVLVSKKGASGGPVDVLRRFSLESFHAADLSDLAEDFFPEEQRGDLFFPEPGCSSPTFVGSHADVASLAAMLLNAGLELLSGVAPMAAAGVRSKSRQLPAVVERNWSNDLILKDANRGGYEIRVSAEAIAEMRAEGRRGRRMRDPKVETGGMLFGAYDEACEFVSVDAVAGPPPDSVLSALFFDHGTVGTQRSVDVRRGASRNRQNFIGLWHTHPFGHASPSQTDDEGMWGLVNLDVIGKRALMLIIGGASWGGWLDGANPPNIYARISILGKVLKRQIARPLGIFVGPTYPGGYAYPARFHDARNGDKS